jgi:hypothetical protein
MEKRMLKANYPFTLTSMANLALIYRNQGRWEAAEKLEMRLIKISKKKLKANYLGTLISMANLVKIYRNQG